MVFITQWLTRPWTQDLIGTLCHSLWQGVAIVALLYVLLNTMLKTRPQMRYVAGMSALVTLLLCVFATFAVLQLDPVTPQPIQTRDQSLGIDSQDTMPSLPTAFPEPHIHIKTSRAIGWQTWALCVWVLGTCGMLIRMFKHLLGVHRLTHQSMPLKDPAILDLINAISAKLGINRCILTFTGDHILSPGVIGFFRPILLLPMSLLTGIPSEDLEAILLHELTHIRRYDYLVNFFQMLIEALLFFNPAVWWINRQIRLEREACCDAVAVETSGQRVRYAELLLQWSRRVPPDQPEVAAMVGLSQSPNQSLIERIKRIALPNHTPQIHLRLSSILVMFFFSALLLAALWKTTDTAVVFAAKILTPAQRAKAIDQIDQDFGGQAVISKAEAPVTLIGTVKAQDGSDLPEDFHLSILGHSSKRSISSGTRVKNGRFHHTMSNHYDSLYLLVEQPGFAPAYAGPYHPEPGDTLKDIEVVLKQGFPGFIEIVDENGKPIKDAVIKGRYQLFKNFSSSSQDIGNMVTDANGRTIITHGIKRPMTVSIRAQGYQFVRNLSVAIEPNTPTRLPLTGSLPTTGTILNALTGQPIAQASLRLWQDHTGQRYGEGRGDIWATTDDQGQFILDTLTSGQPYTFIIETPDHQYTRMKQVAMGDNDRIVRLKPKRHVRGVVLGKPPVERRYDEATQSWKSIPILKLQCGYADEYSSHPVKAELLMNDNALTFDITDVYGDTLRFATGDLERKIELQDTDIENLVIDLRPIGERLDNREEKRDVVLQFNPPPDVDCNDTRVSVSIISKTNREAGHWGQWTKHAIQNNQIQLTMPVPGLLSYSRGFFDPFSQEGKYLRTFWIERESQVPVPTGESLFFIDVPFHPAGIIYGQIQRPTQDLARHASQDVSIQLLAIDRPDYMTFNKGDLEIHTGAHWHPSDRYALAPVPMDGTYVVVARHRFGWIKSQPFEVKEGTSIIQYDLDFPRGVDVTGTILSDAGQPMAQYPVSLRLSGRIGSQDWHSSHHVIHTDHKGHFNFEAVNPEMAGTYSLKINGSDDYEPVEMKIRPRTRPYHIKLTRAARITGRVVNAQGQSLDGLTVFVNEKTRRTTFYQAAIASPSDSNGHFELKGLKHKTKYELRVQSHSLQNNLRFTGGAKTDLTLTVKDQ